MADRGRAESGRSGDAREPTVHPDAIVWSGSARDPGQPFSPATFRLDAEAIAITIHRGVGSGTVVVPLADVVGLSAVDRDDGLLELELETGDGAVGRLRWSDEYTEPFVVALERSGDGRPDAGSERADVRHGTAGTDLRDRVLRSAAMLLLVSGLLIGLLGVYVAVLDSRVHRWPVDRPEVDDGRETWLLLGSDSRSAAGSMPDRSVFGSTSEVPGERADVVLLAQEGDGQRSPRLVSLPRDLLVFLAGHGVDRLALTLLDGPGATATSVCRSLGIPVDHVVTIRFDGIQRLVDTVGGIDVRSELETRDPNTGLHLRPGRNHLNGAGAVAWARSRHPERLVSGEWLPDPDGESVRQSSQRELLSRLASAMAHRAGRDPVTLQRLIWTSAGSVETDSGTGPLDLARLAVALLGAEDGGSVAHVVSDSPIPVARLLPEAHRQLDRFRGSRDSTTPCPRARISVDGQR